MAAGGFKTFTTGEVLTSADTNNFLMQGVLVFNDAAARNAAITAPVEGQVVYLKDTNEVLSYDGSTYVAVGGGSPLTTKGDLYTFSTVDARLPVGANETILVADSSQATGLAYKSAATLYPLTSYTPVVAQNGTRTSTTTYAKHQRIGNTMFVQVLLTITQAGTANNIISVSLPTNTTPNSNDLCMGSFMYKDTGTAFYAGVVNSLTANTVAFTAHNQGAFLGQNPNFAVANNDTISFSIMYEVA